MWYDFGIIFGTSNYQQVLVFLIFKSYYFKESELNIKFTVAQFILLQVVDQFSQQHLLKRLSFFPLYILASFVKDKVSIGAWIYL